MANTRKPTASLLPLLPRIFFLYLEPVIIPCGMVMAYSTRLPALAAGPPYDVAVLSGPGLSATYLLCMLVYGLLILLSSPPNPALLKRHIALLTLADVVHWLVILSTLSEAEAAATGQDPAGLWSHLHPSKWYHDENARMLMLGPLLMFCVKIATLTGLFGRIGDA
ncbi:hypothetical protein PFICI_01562 [Pestalotiopsis fici W106-1]|uniref:Uncharacterized protein n=1 Tax=Pestalotiopsis fici (strain W106-1 / CGMCC3.15140) TaxID=1229662 RepID=W3XP41_PESFW|nr:uncharacterized protein PFICI_01562 [Pestalotiopsis fici W106-1]ETS87734.1 hypothetical protein PFICI_01562 [Pestalotiopsis fici W106-1]